jgi:hypothetical protein
MLAHCVVGSISQEYKINAFLLHYHWVCLWENLQQTMNPPIQIWGFIKKKPQDDFGTIVPITGVVYLLRLHLATAIPLNP